MIDNTTSETRKNTMNNQEQITKKPKRGMPKMLKTIIKETKKKENNKVRNGMTSKRMKSMKEWLKRLPVSVVQ